MNIVQVSAAEDGANDIAGFLLDSSGNVYEWQSWHSHVTGQNDWIVPVWNVTLQNGIAISQVSASLAVDGSGHGFGDNSCFMVGTDGNVYYVKQGVLQPALATDHAVAVSAGYETSGANQSFYPSVFVLRQFASGAQELDYLITGTDGHPGTVYTPPAGASIVSFSGSQEITPWIVEGDNVYPGDQGFVEIGVHNVQPNTDGVYTWVEGALGGLHLFHSGAVISSVATGIGSVNVPNGFKDAPSIDYEPKPHIAVSVGSTDGMQLPGVYNLPFVPAHFPPSSYVPFTYQDPILSPIGDANHGTMTWIEPNQIIGQPWLVNSFVPSQATQGDLFWDVVSNETQGTGTLYEYYPPVFPGNWAQIVTGAVYV
jgi:hypothetical protein